jgi:hypothetical protein
LWAILGEAVFFNMYNRMKICKTCGIEKPPTDFFKQPSTRDGLNSKCKQCQYEYNKLKKYGNSETKKKYYQKNKSKLKAQIMEWNKRKRESDPKFKLSNNIRTLIRESFKRTCKGVYNKPSKTESILGCTIPEFISYIESMLKPGMTFENHGAGYEKWNLDHIIPISSATNKDDIVKLNHYTNFQPLWFEENMAKGKKI